MHVAGALSGQARAIFDYLSGLTNKGAVPTKKEIAAALDRHPETKTFLNGLSTLRGRGLIEYTGRGVELADWLTWEGGR